MDNDFLHLSAAVSLSDSVERPTAPDPFGTEYSETSFRVGYQHHSTPFGSLDLKGGPLVEVGYSAIAGGEGNLGSHRSYQVEALAGWKQNFWRFAFVLPKAGIGYGANYLNFGEGFPLERQSSLNLLLEADAGIEFCGGGGRFCPGLFVAMIHEETLSGAPDYTNNAVMIGVRLAADTSPVAPEIERAEVVKTIEVIKYKEIQVVGPDKPCPPPPPPEAIARDAAPSWANTQMIITFGKVWSEVPLQPNLGENPLKVNPQLDIVAQYMKKNPEKTFFLHGYASESEKGLENLNRTLSWQRVLSVRDYLVKKKGVSGSQIEVDGRFTDKSKSDADGKSVHGSKNQYCRPEAPKDPANQCVYIKEIHP